uniref:RNA polymerase beta' subunit n=1 Tax=Streptofilum capillatum TaxID=2058781 RepID=UPI00286BBF96|nr:RNA polymerase beta' subunit [Streptofilum capillatum]WKT08508.1 RNA polymerase beta' subunit [Streptofilum capillatum]WKT08607.1 RNA polymerase beta' subunit [Streptofilum sp. BC4-VF8pt]WKT08706.1 RNA polymerase beta' subunit [Streptofilum sp. ZNP2-VF4pt]
MSYHKNQDQFLQIHLASPDRIRQWAERILPTGEVVGEVTKPETINYRTSKPERDGLFCERIFGPLKDWQCACGRYKGWPKEQNQICERCGVEITESRVRRYRMGFIRLAYPVIHVWFLKAIPSHISVLLDLPRKAIEHIAYLDQSIVINKNFRPNLLKHGNRLDDFMELILARYLPASVCSFTNPWDEIKKREVCTGATAIQGLLEQLNLEDAISNTRNELEWVTKELEAEWRADLERRKQRLIQRIKLIRHLISSRVKPEWMVLTLLPILPPGLRPMVMLDEGRLATSDLNDLYRRVIYRNNRLAKQAYEFSPDMVLAGDRRMLQEAVDALIDNGRRGRPVVDKNERPLKSLSDGIKGKQGRFRQNLLGKRVDYSGRSVIVVGPSLQLHQCGLPIEMAIELFQPFLIHQIMAKGLANNMRGAKKMIHQSHPAVEQILGEVIQNHPVLLNRAPTLHRLGIQAFQPILVTGRAIQLHPLACPAFNADFDGDQMAVHVPLSLEAQAEARLLMLSSGNLLSPATGEPIAAPSQDMVLGLYFLTMSPFDRGKSIDHKPNGYFSSMEDAITAYEQKQVGLQSYMWLRYPTESYAETMRDQELPIEIKCQSVGVVLKTYTSWQTQEAPRGSIHFKYLRTTVGRILLNKMIQNFMKSTILKKSTRSKLIDKSFQLESKEVMA